MGIRHFRYAPLSLSLWSLLAGSQAFALSPALSVRQYLHTGWTEIEGKPFPAVNHLVQAGDGYLWMGGDAGLLRFDGIRFSAGLPRGQAAPAGIIRSMAGASDGGLWVVTKAGVTHVSPGGSELYPLSAAGGSVGGVIVEDSAGDLWMLLADLPNSSVGAFSPKDRTLRRFGRAEGLPATFLRSLKADGGSFWLGTEGGLCRWRPGSAAVCRPVPGTVESIFRLAPNQVVAASPTTVVRATDGATETLLPLLTGAAIWPNAVIVDRGGNVWVGTTGGLVRIQSGRVERFTRKDGLSGDTVEAILEDREGDIWVATNAGIDRFRDPRVLHLSTLNGLSGDLATVVASTRDGATWMGTAGNGVNRLLRDAVKSYSMADGLPGNTISSLYEDVRGRMWMGAGADLGYLQKGAFRKVADARGTSIGPVFGIAGDVQGTIWAAAARRGLWRVRGGVAEPVTTPFQDLFRVLVSRDGSLWAGSFASGVVTGSGGSATAVYGSDSGVGLGAPRALFEDASGTIWVGAGRTLTRFRHRKATSWGPREGFPDGEIYGIAGDSTGSLWIVSASAVLRVPTADLDRVPDGASYPIRFIQYDSRDGLRLAARGGMGSPRICVAVDGRVWVTERDGVAILDPDLLRPDQIPPPVSVEQLAVDGRAIPGDVPSFRGRELRIAYTGLSLTAPERVHFRYRLDPLEPRWVEADTRREVTFVNLAPGNYHFRVIAANLDEVWNTAGGGVDFRIDPYFSQTIWFKLLLVVAVGLFGFGLYRLRLAQMESRFQLIMHERMRLTREIHDSLLQGFAGVVLKLYGISPRIETDPQDSKKKLDEALKKADETMREAREMLMDMRLRVLEDLTLPEALAEVGTKSTEGTNMSFQLRTKGEIAPLPYAHQAAMFKIGREAITNAVNHAEAGRITVEVVYSEKEFAMTVEDDGKGFDTAAPEPAGHLGLRSMTERARQAGADLHIDSAPGRGTKIEVTLKRKKIAPDVPGSPAV